MNNLSTHRSPVFLFAAAGVLLAVLASSPADARERARSRSATTADGRTAHGEFAMQREAGAASRYRSVEGFNGRGFTRESNRSCVEGSGCSSSASGATNAGAAWSREASAVRNDDGSVSVTRQASGPNGGSASSSGTVSRP